MMFLNNILDLYLGGAWCDIYITVMDKDDGFCNEFVEGIKDIIDMNAMEYCQAVSNRKYALRKYDNMVVKMFYTNKDGALHVTLLKEGL